jgi:DNA-binding response OmpR family regulator
MARILIVEDHTGLAVALTAFLQCSGHEAHAITGRDAALTAAQRLSPDVVISDIRLPSVDGHAMASTLRRRYGEKLRIVALTADDDSGALAQMELAGFDTILIKPASIHDLLEAIR